MPFAFLMNETLNKRHERELAVGVCEEDRKRRDKREAFLMVGACVSGLIWVISSLPELNPSYPDALWVGKHFSQNLRMVIGCPALVSMFVSGFFWLRSLRRVLKK